MGFMVYSFLWVMQGFISSTAEPCCRGVSISNLASPGEYLYEDTAPLLYGWGRNVYSVVGLGEEVRSANVPTHIRCPDLEALPGVYEAGFSLRDFIEI